MMTDGNITVFENDTAFLLVTTGDWAHKEISKNLLIFLMLALCCITTVGNICVIYKYRKASYVGNFFIISLATADLIVGCFVMPVSSVYAITNKWVMTLPVCQIWLIADYTASTASILNLLTLSIDRYWSVTSPLKYLGKRTKNRALIMITIAWTISLLWIFPITGWAYFMNDNVRVVPADKCQTEYNTNLVFKIFTAIFNFYIPLITMIVLNSKIYMVIHNRYRNPIMRYTSKTNCDQCRTSFFNQSSKSMTSQPSILLASLHKGSDEATKEKTLDIRMNKRHLDIEKSPKRSSIDLSKLLVESLPLKRKFQGNGKTDDASDRTQDGFGSNLDGVASVSSKKRKQKMKERIQFSKQEKAFKQLICIVIGFTVCFLPYFIVFLIVALCEDCVSESFYTFTIWLGYLNSTINPFLYALSNRQNNRNSFRTVNMLLKNSRSNCSYENRSIKKYNYSEQRHQSVDRDRPNIT